MYPSIDMVLTINSNKNQQQQTIQQQLCYQIETRNRNTTKAQHKKVQQSQKRKGELQLTSSPTLQQQWREFTH
jgi:hypothetical protein